MIFSVNNSPFAGIEGQYVTSRQIKERLDREVLGISQYERLSGLRVQDVGG